MRRQACRRRCGCFGFVLVLAPFAITGPYVVIFGRLPGVLQALLPDFADQVAVTVDDLSALPAERISSGDIVDDAHAAAGPPAALGGQAAAAPAPVAATPPAAALPAPAPPREKCNLFTLWEYKGLAPLFARLNLESWQRHSHGMCSEPILINDTNIREYVPDMPEEYFRIEYDAAKSDMIRYALLYHNGGIYMDADFLVARDIRDLVQRLDGYDLVSYETGGGQSCTKLGSFSSNFMGGRKGSIVHKAVWEAQKRALTNHCHRDEMKLEKVCCLDDPNVKCHIPWTQLGEGISHKVVRQLLRGGEGKAPPKIFCFRGEESFVPGDLVQIFEKAPRLDDAQRLWKRRGEVNPLGRMAFHLFNSNSGVSKMSRKELFDESTVLGTMYSRSFSDAPDEGPSSLQLLAADAPADLPERLARALRPGVSPRECGQLPGGGWCQNVLEAAAARDARQGLLAISFGAFVDPRFWGLYDVISVRSDFIDCRGAGPRDDAAAPRQEADGGQCPPVSGSSRRVVDSLAQLSAAGAPQGVLLSLDAGGGEWAVLEALGSAELKAVDLLDVRLDLCALLPDGPGRMVALERRVRVLERLREVFGVLAPGDASAAALRAATRRALLCGAARPPGAAPAPLLALVNTERLREARGAASELADRIDRALRPTVTEGDCDGIDDSASNGDGALHSWCLRVLAQSLAGARGVVGLSYGISTWDDWSRRLSDRYSVHTELYDCFETPSNTGHAPSLEGYKVPHTRHDVCIDEEARTDGDGRHFERLGTHLQAQGEKGVLLKVDVEGSEWAALRATTDAELQRVALFDLQIYLCRGGARDDAALLKSRVELLERLAGLFHVVARAPADGERFRGQTDDAICDLGGRYPETISVSYVSRVLLAAAPPLARA